MRTARTRATLLLPLTVIPCCGVCHEQIDSNRIQRSRCRREMSGYDVVLWKIFVRAVVRSAFSGNIISREIRFSNRTSYRVYSNNRCRQSFRSVKFWTSYELEQLEGHDPSRHFPKTGRHYLAVPTKRGKRPYDGRTRTRNYFPRTAFGEYTPRRPKPSGPVSANELPVISSRLFANF